MEIAFALLPRPKVGLVEIGLSESGFRKMMENV